MTRTGKQEAAAWRKLAEEVDASPNRTTLFLCLCVDGTEAQYYPHSKISAPPLELRGKMLARIRAHDWGHGWATPQYWAANPDIVQPRILACLWLAHEAEEEG